MTAPGRAAALLGTAPRLMVMAISNVAVSTQPIFLLGAAIDPMSEEFGFGPRGLGVLTAVFFVTAGLFSAKLGAVVERIGWRVAIRRNSISSATVLLAIAIAARSIWILAILLMAGAVVYGLANPAANLALTQHGAADRKGVLFGIKHAGIPTSTLIAGVALPVVVTPFGWRWAYVLAALLALAVNRLVPSQDPPTTPQTAGAAAPAADALGRRALVVTAVGAFLASSAPAALASFTVAAALDIGIGQSAAGWVLAGASATSIVARFLHGLAIDRRPGNSYRRMSLILAVGAAVLFGLSASRSAVLFVALAIAAFGTAWAWPGLLTYTVVTLNPRRPAASTGVSQSGVFFGAGVMPVAMGALIESRGFGAGWALTAASVLGGGATMWALSRRFGG